jgi:hypothetical protein
MIKGKFEKQVLRFNISRPNSKGEYKRFTVEGVFEGVIEYDIKDYSPYPDERKFEGKFNLKLKTNCLTNLDVWRL